MNGAVAFGGGDLRPVADLDLDQRAGVPAAVFRVFAQDTVVIQLEKWMVAAQNFAYDQRKAALGRLELVALELQLL